jgi:hypothetical protein
LIQTRLVPGRYSRHNTIHSIAMSGTNTTTGGHRASWDKCHQVSALCPVEATVLGYYPNLGSGIFFTLAFGACLVAALSIGIYKRTWTYTAAITIGLVLETAGQSLFQSIQNAHTLLT